MKLKIHSFLLLILFSSSILAQRLDLTEDRFFNDNIPDTQTIVTSLNGTDGRSDSNELSRIIKEVSDAGGGTIILAPHGGNDTFYLGNVTMGTNVHLKIDPRVTIINHSGFLRNSTIFNFGDDSPINNASLTSLNENSSLKADAFKVMLVGGKDVGISAVGLKNVTNFKISGIDVTDSYTRFNNVVLNPPNSNSKIDIATKGIVQNIFSINNHVGYGIAQVQTAKTVLFKNLDGEGGITLRIETGVATVNVDNVSTVDDLVGKNITGRDGDAAVDLAPHRVDQGQVDVTGIVSIGCTYALRISGGFLDKKPGGVENVGTFSNQSYIEIVEVVGGDNAQVKGRDFQFYQCPTQNILRNTPQNPDAESTKGQSIGVIRDTADPITTCNNCSTKSLDTYKSDNPNDTAVNNCSGSTVALNSKVRGCYKPIIILPPANKITGVYERTGDDLLYTYNGSNSGSINNCPIVLGIEDLANQTTKRNSIFYPNPAQDILTIREGYVVTIYDLFGRVVGTNSSKESTIDISGIARGFYMVRVNKSNKIQKLLLN